MPPLRYIRKTTLIFLVVFLSFIGHRIFVSFSAMENQQRKEEIKKSSPLYSVICRNIVGGSPFGVDSVFPLHTRLHYYAELPKRAWAVPDGKIVHVWFNGADTVQKVVCTLAENACESSIAPQKLVPGDWSLDAVSGRKLLSSRQFKVEPSKE